MANLQLSPETIQAYYDNLKPFWHPVLPASDLDENPIVSVELLNTPIVIACLNGKPVAMLDVCRHFQAELSLGEIRQIEGAGECLMCPYHGWSYDATGQCVHIPQLDDTRAIPESARVNTYHVQEKYGLIWVCMADNPTYPIPDLPELDHPDFLTGPLRTYEPWIASAPRAIMAALDDTHGAWVHEGLVGDREHPEPPDHQVKRQDNKLVVNFTMLQPNNATIDDGSDHEELREVEITTTVCMPNVIHFSIVPTDSRDNHVTQIWQAVCPSQYNKTLTFWGSSRNYDKDKPVYDPVFEDMQDTLREQDKRVVESQKPWLLPPFWTKTELPVRPADLPLIEYQKWLEELDIVIQI